MAKHRSKSQKIRDRRNVAELYLAGRYQEEIAVELGLSQATVSRDLRYILAQWQTEAVQDVAKRRAIIEQKYLLVWREAMAAWMNKPTPHLLGQAQTSLKAIRDMFGTDAPAKQEIQVGEEIVITADDMAEAMKRLEEKGYDKGERADDPPTDWIDEIQTPDRP